MVRFVYCKTHNAFGEVAEIIFPTLPDALAYIEAHKADTLRDSAGYSVYTVVPDGQLPETLYTYTRP